MKGDARSLDCSSYGGPISLYTLLSFQFYGDFEFGLVWSRGFGGISPEVATLEPLGRPRTFPKKRCLLKPSILNPNPPQTLNPKPLDVYSRPPRCLVPERRWQVRFWEMEAEKRGCTLRVQVPKYWGFRYPKALSIEHLDPQG